MASSMVTKLSEHMPNLNEAFCKGNKIGQVVNNFGHLFTCYVELVRYFLVEVLRS